MLCWAEGAINKGADALMLRHISSKIICKTFAQIHALKIPILNNHSGHENLDWYGFHLKENETEVVQNRICGKSCHSSDAVLLAESFGVDYVLLSPVFPTKSHPDQTHLGINYLEKVVEKTRIPIFALGGIEQNEHIAACLQAGAYGFAAISYFLDKPQFLKPALYVF